ncbi:MAG: hypothetical protein Q9O62_08575 [Ardenticatenia bacterium]|nr:hypothetical protein [Ardenticatenia bacterium]
MATYLLMTMMWGRLYLSTAALAALFGIDKATVSRNGRRVLAVLRQVTEGEIDWPDPPVRGEGERFGDSSGHRSGLVCPFGWHSATHSTPGSPERQRGFYSAKKKRHTVKNGLVVNEDGFVLVAAIVNRRTRQRPALEMA